MALTLPTDIETRLAQHIRKKIEASADYAAEEGDGRVFVDGYVDVLDLSESIINFLEASR